MARVNPDAIVGRTVVIDGFNILTTIEAALGGAVVLKCRDTTCRDIAGIHGSYRKVAETLPALERLASVLEARGRPCRWLFDRPVSNSGRIRGSSSKRPEARRGLDCRARRRSRPDPRAVARTCRHSG